MPFLEDNLTFFGIPRFTNAVLQPDAVVFGVASSQGSKYKNCRNGPFFIRRLSQRYTWQSSNPCLIDLRSSSLELDRVFDAGNIVSTDSSDNIEQQLYNFVKELYSGCAPIAVGGNHTITLPIISAITKNGLHPVKVVVFDHHLDYQYWSTERDPLFHTNVMTHISDMLGPGNIVHIGVEPIQTVDRKLKNWYLDYLTRAGLQISLFSNIIDDDISILNCIGFDQDVYLSIDVDVLWRGEMQSTAYPSEVGLTLSRLVRLISLIAKQNRVIGCDLVEFAADKKDRTSKTLADAARASLLLLELIMTITKRLQTNF